MKNDKEIVGTLLGFDDFVSILCSKTVKQSTLVTTTTSTSHCKILSNIRVVCLCIVCKCAIKKIFVGFS